MYSAKVHATTSQQKRTIAVENFKVETVSYTAAGAIERASSPK